MLRPLPVNDPAAPLSDLVTGAMNALSGMRGDVNSLCSRGTNLCILGGAPGTLNRSPPSVVIEELPYNLPGADDSDVPISRLSSPAMPPCRIWFALILSTLLK